MNTTDTTVAEATKPATCRLCGGNAGTLDASGAHSLCAALAAQGLPTPCLGHRCTECSGTGRRATQGQRNTVLMLDLAMGPGLHTRAIEAAFPVCPTCAGKGYHGGAL